MITRRTVFAFLLTLPALATRAGQLPPRGVAALAPAARASATPHAPALPRVDLSAADLRVPPGRLLVNLMMEGRLTWFSWMNRSELKPKLVVAWTTPGRTHTKTWQHGVDGTLDAPGAENLTPWNTLGQTEDLGAGITPGVAVGPDGTTHVVFMGDGKIFHRERAPRGRFGPPGLIPVPSEVAAGGAVFNSPHVVCDRSGTLHLVFTHGFTGAARRTWYTNRQGGIWKTPVVSVDQTETGRRTNYPRLATDGTTALVGAFAGGGSTLVELVDLATTPRVAARAETLLWVAHPLLGANREIFVVGRRGAAGHHFERYSAGLVASGPRELLSRGTPTKTLEATAAVIDDAGVIHAAGAAGSPHSVLWYTTSTRARAGKDVMLGPELGTGIKEYTFPTLVLDARGRVYVSFRRHPAGDGQVTVLDEKSGRFETSVTFAPAIKQRLRWNAPLASAPDGGVYAVWEAEGRVFFRPIGQVAEASTPPEK